MTTQACGKIVLVKLGLEVAFAITLGLGSVGCSSLRVRCADRYQNEPYTYPATRDRDGLGLDPMKSFINELPPPFVIAFFGGRDSFHPETLLLAPAAYMVGGVCYLAVDRPVAIVSDTILYPYDRYRIRQYNAVTQFWQKVLSHERAMPLPSCSDLRKYNYPPYVEGALRGYLEREGISRPLLVQLAAADVGNRLVAASRHVDPDLGELLLSSSEDMAGVCAAMSTNRFISPSNLDAVLEHTGDPAVLLNLAANSAVSPHLLQCLLGHSNTNERIVEQIAHNPSAPDSLLSELPPRYDADVARNPRTSTDALARIVDRSLPENFYPYPSASAVWAIAENPASNGELLESIVARYPDRADIGCLVAGHANTPENVLWSLARGGEPAVGSALAKNPTLPADIVAFLARHTAPTGQRILAGRDDLSVEIQTVLAGSDDADVRMILAVNPKLDPDVLLAMARTETHPEPLQAMASLTNAAEEVYLAIAAGTNQPPLRCLASNEAVSETVLRRVLENSDDGTARCVSRRAHASYDTRRRALDAIQEKRSDDRIGSAMLGENRVIDGIEFMAGTQVRFRHDGHIAEGTLAADQQLDGREFVRVLFKQGQRIEIDSTGKVRTAPPLPTFIQGIPCSVKARAYESGRLRLTVLGEEYTVNGIVLPAGSEIELYESGGIKTSALSSGIDVQDIACATNKPVSFYESGRLCKAFIQREHNIAGVICPGGQVVRVLESGAVCYTDAARQHWRAADRLWRENGLDEALRECDRALGLAPNYAAALITRGYVRLTAKAIDDARSDFERALEIEPDSVNANTGIARSYLAQEDWKRGIDYFTEAIRLNSRSGDAFLYRAVAWRKVGEFRRARDDFESVLALFPEYTSVANDLAWILATCSDDECRDGKRALSLAQTVVAGERTGPHLDTLAAAHAELGEFREAAKLQEEAIAALKENGPEELLPQFQKRLTGYRKRKAWRE